MEADFSREHLTSPHRCVECPTVSREPSNPSRMYIGLRHRAWLKRLFFSTACYWCG